MVSIKYTCTCPDYQNQRAGEIFTRGFSSSIPADWTKGETVPFFEPQFQPVEQARFGEQRPCKHIYAAMLKAGDIKLSPTDTPLTSLERRKVVPEEGFAGFIGESRE